jgi:thiol-disulfide isomerase/thioredoxin
MRQLGDGWVGQLSELFAPFQPLLGCSWTLRSRLGPAILANAMRRSAARPFSVLVCAALISCVPVSLRPAADGGLDLASTIPSGESFRLDGPGPVRLVEVWATWCEPCLKAAPKVKRVLDRHPRVAGFSLSIDDDPAVFRGWLGEHEVPGKPLHLTGGFAMAHRRGIDRIPFAFVLDTRGRLVGSLTGLTPNYEALLERMVRTAEGAARDPE